MPTKHVVDEWEAFWSGFSVVVLIVSFYVPYLSTIGWLAMIAGVSSVACGLILALLYFAEIGNGRGWLGGFLPTALAGWGVSRLLHLPI